MGRELEAAKNIVVTLNKPDKWNSSAGDYARYVDIVHSEPKKLLKDFKAIRDIFDKAIKECEE